MATIALFFSNAALNFVLGLVVARFLGPAEFGAYALAAALGTLVNTLLFDWLRLSATRFTGASQDGSAAARSTLDLLLLSLCVSVTIAALALYASGATLGLPPGLAALAVGSGVALAAFDYSGAVARARFANRAYAVLLLVKNGLAFTLIVGAAALTGSALLAAVGFVVSSLAASLALSRALAEPGARRSLARAELARTFAIYGLPLVVGGTLLQAMPFLNRAVLGWRFGLAEAGQFSLAYDIGVRVLAALGSALDAVMLQWAVRAAAQDAGAARAQLSRNFSLIVACLLPVGAGYLAVLPSFAQLAVSPEFREPFIAHSAVIVPGLILFSVANYAITPTFQIGRRTWPVTTAWAAALAVNAALLFGLLPRLGPAAAGVALVGGFATALGVLGILAARFEPFAPRWRDLAAAVLATLAMLAAAWPLRALEPGLATLALQVTAGAAAFGAVALMLNLGGARGVAGQRLRLRSIAASFRPGQG